MKAQRGIASCLVLTGAVAWLAAGTPAWSQNRDADELMNRLERIQRELNTLQQAVYRGERAPASAAAPATGGTGGLDRRAAARLELRLSQLETELRRVTGKAEELEHAIGLFNRRLDKLVSDVDVRLNSIESGSAGPARPDTGALPPAPPVGMNRPGVAPDAPPRTLGSIRRRAAAARQPTPSAPSPALPAGTPKEQYEYATSLLLADQNIEEAERALSAFIDVHPKHRLTSNAHYWLGETYYVRKNFQQAAYTFADGFQRFPKSSKAADNLLKLGMSLGQLGKQKQACTAFSRLLANFPSAKKSLRSRITREQRRFKCR